MRDFLEVIAQQIDKAAAKPLDLIVPLGGSFAMWQWVGWWGVVGFLAFLLFVTFMVDVVVYFLCRRQTYASYGDSRLWMSGFHPFKARSVVRKFDRDVKKYGEETIVAEFAKLGATVSRKEPAR